MPHFALVTTDGDALGTVELGRPDWPDGAIIYRGDEPNLRYGAMQFVKPAITTIAVEIATSTAALLLAGGAHGRRMALPNAKILIHQALGGASPRLTRRHRTRFTHRRERLGVEPHRLESQSLLGGR